MNNNLPSLLIQAAHSAAVADGLIPDYSGVGQGDKTSADAVGEIGRGDEDEQQTPSAQETKGDELDSPDDKNTPTNASSKTTATPKPLTNSPVPPAVAAGKKKGPSLRRGKWTPEEEAYANRLIQEFKAGLLPLTDGTTLRTFLSKLLNCDPMRISKKFVGNNCIGKQVFRRRTAEINRLTSEQIQSSQHELSELERRFLDRVAQTNRVKTSSNTTAGGPTNNGNSSSGANNFSSMGGRSEDDELKNSGGYSQPSSSTDARDLQPPPWLAPPANLLFNNSRGINRAAAIGRALLQESGLTKGSGPTNNSMDLVKSSKGPLASHGSAGLLALAEMQRQQNMQVSILQNQQALKQLAAFQKCSSGVSGEAAAALANNSGLTSSVMAQLARSASAARLASIAASQGSLNSIMLKTALSRDQMSQLARDGNFGSTSSLRGMGEGQNSFDALMSLDFQSLQSIDNLANLLQTGGSGSFHGHIPKTGIKNWNPLDSSGFSAASGQPSNFSSHTNSRRVASQGRMDSLIRSLSSGQGLNGGRIPTSNQSGLNLDSNASFSNLLQNLSGNLSSVGNVDGSMDNMHNLLNPSNPLSTLSIANMLHGDSSTGLSAMRMKDGLVQRNSSVDDFLSLVASGDIPHQDPHMLNMPLQSVMQQQGSAQVAAATLLAQQQFFAQAAAAGHAGNSSYALSEAIRASSTPFSFLNQWAQTTSGPNGAVAAALSQQQQAQLSAMAQANGKRKYNTIEEDVNGSSKRQSTVEYKSF